MPEVMWHEMATPALWDYYPPLKPGMPEGAYFSRILAPSGGVEPGSAGVWWSERTGGLIGGTAGAVIGCIGTLLGWLASRGRSRSFVVGTAVLFVVLGGFSLLAGLLAIAMRQPYGVWFVLVLAAYVAGNLCGATTRAADELELRKMHAMDAWIAAKRRKGYRESRFQPVADRT